MKIGPCLLEQLVVFFAVLVQHHGLNNVCLLGHLQDTPSGLRKTFMCIRADHKISAANGLLFFCALHSLGLHVLQSQLLPLCQHFLCIIVLAKLRCHHGPMVVALFTANGMQSHLTFSHGHGLCLLIRFARQLRLDRQV
jgi:hypothetical protein